jgi:putative Mn2+ efflux pump MntP
MGFTVMTLIAVSLAMDCFAVAISAGTSGGNFKFKNLVIMAILFGSFQSVMVMAGWLAGTGLKEYIESVDHWIAFGLLAVIGGKMVFEGFEKEEQQRSDYISWRALIALSFATSIDALAVGVGFSVLKSDLIMPVIFIGAASFFLTLIGGMIGKKAGELLGKRAEIAGGLILIGIGVKILFEHLKII